MRLEINVLVLGCGDCLHVEKHTLRPCNALHCKYTGMPGIMIVILSASAFNACMYPVRYKTRMPLKVVGWILGLLPWKNIAQIVDRLVQKLNRIWGQVCVCVFVRIATATLGLGEHVDNYSKISPYNTAMGSNPLL